MTRELLKIFLIQKSTHDLIWNYVSFIIMGISGIVMNLIIAGAIGVQGVGVFNQIMAVYVLVSQVAVGGVHYSVLKHVAEFAHEPGDVAKVVWSSFIVVVSVGGAVAVAAYFGASLIGEVIDSAETGRGIALAAPGLLLFALNKVLLSVLNGLQRMRAFAVGQALRYIFMMAAVSIIATTVASSEWLGLVFTGAEALLSFILMAMVVQGLPDKKPALSMAWMKTHSLFGVRAFLSGLAMEVNARVDVLMLSVFLSDSAVGIYSFAAMLAEGLYGLLGVIRNQVNPSLVTLLRDGDTPEIRVLVGKVQRWVIPAMFVLVAAVCALYVPAINFVYGESELVSAWVPLMMLGAGIVFCSGFVPFDTILIQGGRPGRHAIFMALVVLSNVVMNALLIPPFGVNGAAAATALSLALSVFYLRWFAKRFLGVKIGLLALAALGDNERVHQG